MRHKEMMAIGTGVSFADTHIHSNFSDGVSTIKQILDTVERRENISVIAITDHNTIKGAYFAASLSDYYSFDIIVGEEIMTTDGEIIGLFLNEEIRPGLSAVETIYRIHEQGGLAIAPHPFVIQLGDMGGRGLWWKTAHCDLDGFERMSGNPLLGYNNLMAAYFFSRLGLACHAGSDAHMASTVGSVVTVFEGRGAEDFRRAVIERKIRPIRVAKTRCQLLAYSGTVLKIIKSQQSMQWMHRSWSHTGRSVRQSPVRYWKYWMMGK
ncbi:MAG: PHP domain-containing protein [Chloroflexi bacterium]|nr:PHP domain-containing protein [Chloroflexota bacterium]